MSTTPGTEDVLAAIREELAEIKVPGAESAEPSSTWSDLDVDSLDLVELGQIVQDEYGVELKSDDMPRLKTVGDAIDLIVERANS